MDEDLVDQLVDVAQKVVASGAISANGHGNVSLRVPGAEEMYFTAGPSLRNHAPASVVRVRLDGTLLEGNLPPIQGAVVAMHTAMYADHPDVGCVLHTHSPYATAYAVAHRPIGCWVEALAMFGLPSGVPVADYGPRGSDHAVANIRASIIPGVPAVLLANHGVLVFHRTPELTILVGGIVEEAAQAGINAGSLEMCIRDRDCTTDRADSSLRNRRSPSAFHATLTVAWVAMAPTMDSTAGTMPPTARTRDATATPQSSPSVAAIVNVLVVVSLRTCSRGSAANPSWNLNGTHLQAPPTRTNRSVGYELRLLRHRAPGSRSAVVRKRSMSG